MKGHFVPSKKTASYIGALCLTVLSIGLLASLNSSNVGWPMRAYVNAPARVDRKCVQRFVMENLLRGSIKMQHNSCGVRVEYPLISHTKFLAFFVCVMVASYHLCTLRSPTRATALHMLFRFVLLCLPLHSLLPPTLKHRNGSFTELDISGILVTTNTLEVICRRCQRLEKLRMGEK